MTLARQANTAWDEGRMVDFDRLVRKASEADLIAFLEPPQTIAAEPPTALVDHRHSVAACADGRESAR